MLLLNSVDNYRYCLYILFIPILSGYFLMGVVNTQATVASNRYKRSDNIKLIDTLVTGTYSQPSASSCLSRCTTVSDCVSVSWNPSTAECLVSGTSIVHGNQPSSNTQSNTSWISYGKMNYKVWHVQGATVYSLTLAQAQARCAQENGRVAYTTEVLEARASGFSFCACSWMIDGTNGINGFVLQSYNPACWGSFNTGIIVCGLGRANAFCADDL